MTIFDPHADALTVTSGSPALDHLRNELAHFARRLSSLEDQILKDARQLGDLNAERDHVKALVDDLTAAVKVLENARKLAEAQDPDR